MQSESRTRPIPYRSPNVDVPSQQGPDPAATDHEVIDLNVPPVRSGWVVLAAFAIAGLLLVLLAIGLVPRYFDGKQLTAETADYASAPVPVNAIHPRQSDKVTKITLPGSLRPWQEVSLFARTTGYLKDYVVDISDQVKKGAQMALIESPEVDQQLLQGKATVKQGEAAVKSAMTNQVLAKITYERYLKLFESKSTTPQDLDEKKAAVDAADAAVEAASANVNAEQANVDRLTRMQSFENLIAPFDGVVTGRAYDRGSLILADPTAVGVLPAFKLAENDILRVFVNVPQSASLQIVKGMHVQVMARERPNRVFDGMVMGTTNYLDATNRSLLTEVKVSNSLQPDGTYTLLPGMYVQVNFEVVRDSPPVVIPSPALVNNSEGTRVPVIINDRVHFQAVTVGLDFGKDIEITSGLTADDKVIANPGESIVEGAPVNVVAMEENKPAASTAPATQPTTVP